MKKVLTSIIITCFFFTTITVSAEVVKQENIGPGMVYSQNNIEKSNSHIVEVDLNNPYASVEITTPSEEMIVSEQVSDNSWDNHLAMAGINASFFDKGAPMNLVVQNNQIVEFGKLYPDSYVADPIAFGITSDGKALIDSYDLQLSYTADGNHYEIDTANEARKSGMMVVYTGNGYTNTTQYGTEVVVEGNPATLTLGESVTGTVTSIRKEGQTNNTKIPSNGFVLSGSGEASLELQQLQVGDTVTYETSIDSKWIGAQSMVASGPQLVRNGQIDISMDSTNKYYSVRAPRTAIGVDYDENKVMMVTVDGRNTGGSKGMNIPELAEYMLSLGVDSALNLDGGGSTTMVTRMQGKSHVELMNLPSDGEERSVFTTIQAVSTAPSKEPYHLNINVSSVPIVGESVEINVTATDRNYQKAIMDKTKLTISVDPNIGTTEGTTFTPTKAGEGNMTISYGKIREIIPIKVWSLADMEQIIWYESNLDKLLSSDGQQLTREQSAAMIVRALDIPKSPFIEFTDVSKDNLFKDEISTVVNTGIMDKTGETIFSPTKEVTNREFSTSVNRAVDYIETNPTAFTWDNRCTFRNDLVYIGIVS